MHRLYTQGELCFPCVKQMAICVRGVGGLRVVDASVMLKVPVKMLSVIERLQISPVVGVRDS